ncbi:hypothetical protein FJTKL_01892 [Diaporthe vaccinii]|uniref:Uncharacterized protein n=1 Tax=Diaporthe vaccinii TaxID=105482 RepID=A0ABR4F4M3_9PEZI
MITFDKLDLSSLDLEFLEEFQGSDDDEDGDPLLAQSTKGTREHLRKIWYRFWTVAKKDPEKIWIDLCQPREAARATKLCETFLHTYATRTRKRRICLGPEEYELQRSVTAATTLLLCWRSLVVEFDQTVLARKRREDPDNMAKWSLKFKNGLLQTKGQGPVADVSRWIGAHAEDMGLTREQTFVEKEATAEDIALVLRTLWTRAEDIPCDPVTQVSFHNTVLLGGICGFRPGVLENLKYRQVALLVLRDPRTQRKRIVASFTVRQNKQRTGAIRRDQSNVLEFSITLVPQKIFCPVSLVVARALADDAFEPSFDSVHSLLSRPNLEHTQCIQLKWKDDALDREIFPLTYNRFGELWRRAARSAYVLTPFASGQGTD